MFWGQTPPIAPTPGGSLLDEEAIKRANAQGLLGLGAGLLSASGPSLQPTSLGQALGQGIQQMRQAREGAVNTAMNRQMANITMQQKQREMQLAEQKARQEAQQANAWNAQFGMGQPVQVASAEGGGLPGGQPASPQAAMNPMLAEMSPAERQAIYALGPVEGPKMLAKMALERDSMPPIAELQQYRDTLPEGSPARAEVDARINRLTTSNPLVNVTNREETEEAKTVGKWQAEQYTKLQDAATAARSSNARLDRLGQLLDQTYTGAGAENLLELKRVGENLFGMDFEGIAEAEAGQALSAQMALELRNPAGGAGMPGAMSDRDREFLQSMVPGLGQTKEGRALMIETQKRLNNRSIEVARMARKYRKDNGRLDEGFYDELEQWSAENPLFNDLSTPDPAASGPNSLPSTPEELQQLSDDEVLRLLGVTQQ